VARRPRRDLFDPASRALAQKTIEAIEAQTSAEVVIALRRVSGDYRAADYIGGSLLALVALLVLVFHPARFDERWFAIDLACAWVIGGLVTSRSDRIRRLFSGARRQREAVAQAARAAFVERGVSKTRGRTGILIYLSCFERDAEVVLDVGVSDLGPSFAAQVARLREAMRSPDPELVLPAIEALAPYLAEAHPRGDDDINELLDEVHAP